MPQKRMIPTKKCQITDCHNRAMYGIYETQPNSDKRFLYVCFEHEKSIGDNNLRLQGIDPETKKYRSNN